MGSRGDYSWLFGTKQGMLMVTGVESRRGKKDGSGKMTLHLVCQCDCGNVCYIIPSNIVNKKIISCGCARRQRYTKSNSHGMSKTRFYSIWAGMLKRCNNKSSPSYVNYGARGVSVSEKWNDFIGFKEDMYESYKKHVEEFGEINTSIERIDVNGDYTAENCTWATRKQQNTNTRQVMHYEYNGELLDLAEIARREGMNYRTLRARLLQYDWTLADALERSHLRGSKKKSEVYDYKGEIMTLKQIAELEGIGYTTLFNRIKNIGLSLEEAIQKVPHKKTR